MWGTKKHKEGNNSALSTLQNGEKPLQKLSLSTDVRVLTWGGGGGVLSRDKKTDARNVFLFLLKLSHEPVQK